MFGCGGGAGIDVYEGGRRRRTVASNILRTGAVSAAATPSSPASDVGVHRCTWRSDGRPRGAVLAVKQLPAPAPVASARSARPLPDTRLPETRLPRARQGGPGSLTVPGSKTIRRA